MTEDRSAFVTAQLRLRDRLRCRERSLSLNYACSLPTSLKLSDLVSKKHQVRIPRIWYCVPGITSLELPGLNKLHALHIWSREVSDAGLVNLQGLNELEDLDLYHACIGRWAQGTDGNEPTATVKPCQHQSQ